MKRIAMFTLWPTPIQPKEVKVKVYRNPDTQEFICKKYLDKRHQPNCDYFTTDRQDAICTGSHMVETA